MEGTARRPGLLKLTSRKYKTGEKRMKLKVSHLKESQDFAEQSMVFAKSLLQSSAAVFTWADSQDQFLPHAQIGWPESTTKEYYSIYSSSDPLNIYRLIGQGIRVAVLRDTPRDTQHENWNFYQQKFGLVDEVGFLFWSGTTPVGCLSIIRTSGDPTFACTESFDRIHAFIEHGLSLLPAVKHYNAQSILKNDYGLTEREWAVTTLISDGLSNKDIGEALNIELSTVKSHVIRILGKLGLDNRTQIAAFCNHPIAPRA